MFLLLTGNTFIHYKKDRLATNTTETHPLQGGGGGGQNPASTNQLVLFFPKVLWIQICKFLNLPDPSIIQQNIKKNLDFYCLMTFYDFKTAVNVRCTFKTKSAKKKAGSGSVSSTDPTPPPTTRGSGSIPKCHTTLQVPYNHKYYTLLRKFMLWN